MEFRVFCIAGGGTRTASRRTSLPTGRRPAVVPDLDDGDDEDDEGDEDSDSDEDEDEDMVDDEDSSEDSDSGDDE